MFPSEFIPEITKKVGQVGQVGQRYDLKRKNRVSDLSNLSDLNTTRDTESMPYDNTPRPLSPSERRNLLLDTASRVAALKLEAKDIATEITGVKDRAGRQLKYSPKVLALALTYLDLDDLDRADADAALLLAQQALDRSGMDDLFAPRQSLAVQDELDAIRRRTEAAAADAADMLDRIATAPPGACVGDPGGDPGGRGRKRGH